MADLQSSASEVRLPRVAITYCTQCKWMLRAAYFGQELLSTFGTSIGEIALSPATGGTFTVYLTYRPLGGDEPITILLWDRKAEGGFPETKILKQRLRNHIEPEKNLGHSDTPSKKVATLTKAVTEESSIAASSTETDPSAGVGASSVNSNHTPATSEQPCQDCG